MRWLVAGLLICGACAGEEAPQASGIDECFREVAESYEQTVDVIDGELGPLLADMGTATRDILRAAETRDAAALRTANDAYQVAADEIVALGNDFSRELDEARSIDTNCQ